MARIAGRQARSDVADQEPLRVRVSPENSQKVDRAAAALGISKAAYVDALLTRERLDPRGRPVWWSDPVPTDQEELPLTRSA
jgi:hypothetical protein